MKAGNRRGTVFVLVALGAGLSITCHEDRTDPAAPTYRTDVQALLEKRCVSCHGDDNPAGGWRATSYLDVISCVANRPATLPADDSAPILLALSSATHSSLVPASERSLLATWVKSGTPAYPPNHVHPAGFPDPRSPDFHGKFLRDERWSPIRSADDEHTCGRCHEGAPVRPDKVTLGAPGASACTKCHTDPQGALGCTSCHGDPSRGLGRVAPPRDKCFFAAEPMKSGAHQAHVAGGNVRAGGLQCAACHPVPSPDKVFEGSHANGNVDVAFDATITMGSYDKQTQTCTVGCHNRGGARPTPKWTDVGPLACGDCHSAPPAKHYAGACSTCHREANADGTRVAGPMHLDGKVDLGDGSGKCGACHGQGDDPFPTTRAHPAHANPKITTPVACGTCHVVTAMAPQQIKTPNHMNGKVEVVLGGRALDRGAQPTWNGAACSDVACHGAKLPQQPFVVAPQWADPTHIPAACGACHQLPPTTGHTTSVGCDSVDCHGSIVSLDAKNVPSITSFGKTLHINGQIDRF